MVWKSVSPQNSYAKILMPEVMLLERGVLGRRLGRKGRAAGNGSRAPINGAPRRPSAPATASDSLNWERPTLEKAEVQTQEPSSMAGEQSQVRPYWNNPVLRGTLGHLHSLFSRWHEQGCSLKCGLQWQEEGNLDVYHLADNYNVE